MVCDAAGIGGGAGIHHYVTIGESAFVGGLARVARDVPPFMIAEGHPAEVRAVNVVGMTRRGISPEEMDAMKDTFRRLFRDNGNMMDNLISVGNDYASLPAVMEVCRSLHAAAAGTHGRAREAGRSDDKWTGSSCVTTP